MPDEGLPPTPNIKQAFALAQLCVCLCIYVRALGWGHLLRSLHLGAAVRVSVCVFMCVCVC